MSHLNIFQPEKMFAVAVQPFTKKQHYICTSRNTPLIFQHARQRWRTRTDRTMERTRASELTRPKQWMRTRIQANGRASERERASKIKTRFCINPLSAAGGSTENYNVYRFWWKCIFDMTKTNKRHTVFFSRRHKNSVEKPTGLFHFFHWFCFFRAS